MKNILLILLALQSSLALAQSKLETTEVEKKYANVEVWGLKDQSRKDFLTEITSYPEGICQQSLTKMGYPDGNKIPMNGKILVTIRDNPDYRLTDVYKALAKKPVKIDERKWITLLNAELGFYEKQQLPYFLKAPSANETEKVDSIFDSLEKEFKNYGIDLEKQKVLEAYDVYKRSSQQLTKQEVLTVLYFSDNDTLIQAANFIASSYIRSSEDLLDFMPLLLRKSSNIQIALNQYIKDTPASIKWKKHMHQLPDLLNNPNPFKAVLVLEILDKTGFDTSLMKELQKKDLMTLKEILKSNAVPDEKSYVMAFLNRYSSEPIETDPNVWGSKL